MAWATSKTRRRSRRPKCPAISAALGRDIVASCERLARGEGRGRVWCTVHAKALPVQQFFKAKGYRLLGPAEEDETTRLPGQLIFERML